MSPHFTGLESRKPIPHMTTKLGMDRKVKPKSHMACL